MSKTIEGVPDFLTHEQYLSIFAAVGFDPDHVFELRMARDGVHAIVGARDQDGQLMLDRTWGSTGYLKHRVFIPIRRQPDDRRRTRVRDIEQTREPARSNP